MVIKKKVKQIPSCSFIRYHDYKTYPLKAKLKHIDKIAEPPNDAMARGAKIHDMADDYIKGKLTRLPAELKLFKDEFKKLRQKYKKDRSKMVAEDTWAFTSKWVETAWNDWTNCWVRIKLDCAHQEQPDVLEVIDWKTGKFRAEMNEDYLEQLELYALGAFLAIPTLKEVRPRLKYLDVGTTYPSTEELVYTVKDVPKLKKAWEKRVKAMMSDKVFAPKPNNLCKWCFYRKSNAAAGGGQCKF